MIYFATIPLFIHSLILGIPVEHVNATFAGIFATAYLGLEMVLFTIFRSIVCFSHLFALCSFYGWFYQVTKVMATVLFLIFPDSAEYVVFSTYAIIAVVASFVVATLR